MNVRGWETLYSPRHPLHGHPLARLLNSVVTAHVTMGDMDSTPDPCLNDGDGEDVATDFIPRVGSEDRPPSWW